MPNKIYRAVESAITFQDSGGTVVMSLSATVATGAGRISAQYDRGSGSKPRWFRWRATFQNQAGNATLGESIDLFLATAKDDGSEIDGNVGSADAALTDIAKLRNLQYFGTVTSDTTSSNTNMSSSGFLRIDVQRFSMVAWNAQTGGTSLRQTANTSIITLTPVPDEVQS